MTPVSTDLPPTTPESRLLAHGIELPTPPSPVAMYVAAVRSGDHIHTSGQLPLVDGELLHPGLVGDEVSIEDARIAAQRCAVNALAAVRVLSGGLGTVTRVLKLTVFVASAQGFTAQPQVANGASELMIVAFGPEVGTHVRSAVGVSALPLNSCVEVEMIVECLPTESGD